MPILQQGPRQDAPLEGTLGEDHLMRHDRYSERFDDKIGGIA